MNAEKALIISGKIKVPSHALGVAGTGSLEGAP